jgi:hypothetical protein
VYGQADPALTYTLSEQIDVTGALTRAAGTNVGSYAITMGNLNASSSNYGLQLVASPVNFAITPRALAVAADAQSKAYADADPALTYKVTSGSLVGTDVFAGALSRAPVTTSARTTFCRAA